MKRPDYTPMCSRAAGNSGWMLVRQCVEKSVFIITVITAGALQRNYIWMSHATSCELALWDSSIVDVAQLRPAPSSSSQRVTQGNGCLGVPFPGSLSIVMLYREPELGR